MISQSYSPPSSPLQKPSQHNNKEQIQVEAQINNNQYQQMSNKNSVILGEINSFYFFNEVHNNIFQSNTSSLINMSRKRYSSQTSLFSNLSTAHVTPDKELEFKSNNVVLVNEDQFQEIPVAEILEESEYDKQLKAIKNKQYIDTDCNCQTTSCQKNYCSCYSNNNYCVPSICKCKSCLNNPDFSAPIQQIRPSIAKKQISCSCSKSYCKKNYCDCFKAGIKCTSLCKCNDCFNQVQNELTNKDNYIAC